MLRKARWESLAAALGFVFSLALLGILEATHTPDPLMAHDNGRVAKVMLSVALAAACSTVSLITAARNVSYGDWWPLAWLVPLAIGWYVFIDFWLLPIVRSMR